jgi:hypothetical protein
MTPPGIETATFWFLAQCRKQMHHRVSRITGNIKRFLGNTFMRSAEFLTI